MKFSEGTSKQAQLTGQIFDPFSLPKARLVLNDGTVFEGFAAGKTQDIVTGEVVFHTGMSGYQEILTDPSYAGQIITFTYPHIGNYGVNENDNESTKIFASGAIVRDLSAIASNWQSSTHMSDWLKQQGVMLLTGIDTRKLTKHIREHGALPAAFGTADIDTLTKTALTSKGTEEQDLIEVVTTDKSYTVGDGSYKVIAYDFGIKSSILKYLSEFATVTVVPASTTAEEIIKLKPDGVFLSNGPGDPSRLKETVENVKKLLQVNVPIFGICLGHQLLATALGARTEKLLFGHHGANHPIMDQRTGKVEITSQNHNYAVPEAAVKNADITHVNLNDGVVSGIRSTKHPAFSVQYHPEAGPGPHDSLYLFDEFKELMEEHK